MENILRENNCWDYLWKSTGGDAAKDNKIKELDQLPLCRKPGKSGIYEYFLLSLNGSPKWDQKFGNQLAAISLLILIMIVVVIGCFNYFLY